MSRALNRHYAEAKMWRRLKEHQAQESILRDFCECNFEGKRRARFKEQPQLCSCHACGNRRRYEGETLQERRADSLREGY